MFNISGSEIVIILLLALIVLGPEKLPEAIRRFGRVYAELRNMSQGFQSEVRSAFEDPMRELKETADLTRRAVMNPLGEDGPSVDQVTPKKIAEQVQRSSSETEATASAAPTAPASDEQGTAAPSTSPDDGDEAARP